LTSALDAGAPVESVYVAPGGRDTPAVAGALERAFAAGARVFDLAPGVLERLADTVTPQPVVAVVGFAPVPLANLEGSTLVLVLADVRDPGNAGTMIRTADAAGVDGVVCCDGTVDPTNPKTVRASAGSLFQVPVAVGGEASDVLDLLRSSGLTAVGAEVRGGVDYTRFDWRRRIALVVGNEASGLDPAVRNRLDHHVSIPMAGQAESLNVSVSAAVLCFEALRRRRSDDCGDGDLAGPTISEMTTTSSGRPRPQGDTSAGTDR
jgi:RNA methyltransferase, TrmH family